MDEENQPGHLEPQLVGGAPEGSTRGADPAHDGTEGAAASRLLAGHASHHAQLS